MSSAQKLHTIPCGIKSWLTKLICSSHLCMLRYSIKVLNIKVIYTKSLASLRDIFASMYTKSSYALHKNYTLTPWDQMVGDKSRLQLMDVQLGMLMYLVNALCHEADKLTLVVDRRKRVRDTSCWVRSRYF